MVNQTEELEGILDFLNATSGSVKAIQINVFIMIAHFVCCLIGIPLNVFIASVIVSMRRLRSKPRNILLLGLILSNLSAFVPVLMELAYLHFPSLELCRTYAAISGLPYILFVINTLLAMVDRYTAIAHPLWHFNQVTPVLIVRCQLVASLTASFVYKFPYVAQFLPLSCELQLLQEFNSIAITLMILFSSCILAHVIVYRQTKRVLANYVPKGWKRGTFTSSKNEKRAAVVTRSEGVHHGSITVTTLQQPLPIFQQPLSSMNSEGPFILFTLTVFLCRFSSDEQVCSSLAWLAPYLKELVVLHAVYHPAIQLSRSSELSSALKQWLNSRNW